MLSSSGIVMSLSRARVGLREGARDLRRHRCVVSYNGHSRRRGLDLVYPERGWAYGRARGIYGGTAASFPITDIRGEVAPMDRGRLSRLRLECTCSRSPAAPPEILRSRPLHPPRSG